MQCCCSECCCKNKKKNYIPAFAVDRNDLEDWSDEDTPNRTASNRRNALASESEEESSVQLVASDRPRRTSSRALHPRVDDVIQSESTDHGDDHLDSLSTHLCNLAIRQDKPHSAAKDARLPRERGTLHRNALGGQRNRPEDERAPYSRAGPRSGMHEIEEGRFSLPVSVYDKLYAHQVEGVKWLWSLFKLVRLGGHKCCLGLQELCFLRVS